ncbi:MAG TPA: hypothetical protein VG273_20595 [Bryobacteraceae bacterium]|jgi:hypothetical protein|nr:hypothetical protein [Bryobacteraceae bacterium]
MATAQIHQADSTQDPVEEAAKRLRNAVNGQTHDAVETHIAAYCAAVRDRLATLPGQDSRCRGAMTHAIDLLEWVRLMLSARRAMCLDQLERAAFADRYLGPQIPPAPGMLVDL